MTISLQTAQAIQTAVIAVYVAGLGTMQWFTSREQFRLNLYDRRFEIYRSTINYAQGMILPVSADLMADQRKEFVNAMFAAKFLFSGNPEIPKMLDECNRRSFRIVSHRARQKDRGPFVIPGETKQENEYQADLEWLVKAMDEMTALLLPYMGFSQSSKAFGFRRPGGRSSSQT